MKKHITVAISIALVLVLALSQVTAVAATSTLPSAALKTGKTSDGTLYWKMTNKQFVNAFNSFAIDGKYEIAKYKSKSSFAVLYTDAVKMQIHTTNDGYVRKISVKYTLRTGERERDATYFANVALPILVAMTREDSNELALVYNKMNIDENTIAKRGRVSSVIIRNGVRFQYTVDSSDNPGITLLVTPSTKANTK